MRNCTFVRRTADEIRSINLKFSWFRFSRRESRGTTPEYILMDFQFMFSKNSDEDAVLALLRQDSLLWSHDVGGDGGVSGWAEKIMGKFLKAASKDARFF
jgi:hypothetical protein